MRFLLFDRITELEAGRRIVGVKTFTLAERAPCDHFPRSPLVPASMLVEAMAQLLGWGVIHAHDFQLMAILCLLDEVTVRTPLPGPGFAATVGGELLSTSDQDSLGRAWLEVGGERVASAGRVIYRHFRPVDSEELRRQLASWRGGDLW
jgi:3-hydroxymyristoyl/3-hydroxydecanoyl-(acyl carrier protein) dehydratase